MLKRLRKILVFLASIYIGVLLVLMIFESSLIYPAPVRSDGDWEATWLPHEDVNFKSDDGTELHGWYCEHPQAQHTILFCHGNGEHVAYLAEELDFIRRRFQASVFAYDYRGYGKSAGRPYEAGILADCEAAQRWLAERTGQPSGHIVIFGRSLGGAVAVHLAAAQSARALVLDRTFSSMVDVAASHYPWVPVKFLLRNRYPSTVRIAQYSGPLIQFHGEQDEVVPFRFGQDLFAACPSLNKLFVASAPLTHNSPWPVDYYERMAEFLEPLSITP